MSGTKSEQTFSFRRREELYCIDGSALRRTAYPAHAILDVGPNTFPAHQHPAEVPCGVYVLLQRCTLVPPYGFAAVPSRTKSGRVMRGDGVLSICVTLSGTFPQFLAVHINSSAHILPAFRCTSTEWDDNAL